MKFYTTTETKLRGLVHNLIEQKWRVIGRDSGGLCFVPILEGNELILDPGAKPTKISAKEHFFPCTEPVFYYRKETGAVVLSEPPSPSQKTALIGVKPCDAAGVPILSKIFNWDYKDDFFNLRAENTVIISLACDYKDEECFCTSVGLHPDSEKGSDIFILPAGKDFYIIKELTPKGEDFIRGFPQAFDDFPDEGISADARSEAPPEKLFDTEKVKGWLEKHFDDKFWEKAGETCLGCSQCAFTCPVCHCFDIVDEHCGPDCGKRMKNWDACQSGLFTLHASGHNPRDSQSGRYRQRVSHKFKYYHDKFGEILCTGCGRCSRGCPAGINIAEIAAEINSKN